jgi:hypothetical protein
MKNVEPKVASEIENDASLYSNACNNVKYTPRITVMIRAFFPCE